MSWKSVGQPTVRQQRDKWVVRIDGIDTVTGKRRPRQVGTYSSQRSALAAAREFRADERSTERELNRPVFCIRSGWVFGPLLGLGFERSRGPRTRLAGCRRVRCAGGGC